MPSPFPGMDPYLEVAPWWPEFHQQLVAAIYQVLVPGLVDRYRARVGARKYMTEFVLFTSVTREEQCEPAVEIRHRGDGRLITLVEVVSPTNKTNADGRVAYLVTRAEALRQGANVVEVDLVLDGKPTLDYSTDGLPDWDYAVTVTRAAQPARHEIYTATIRKALPRFRLPLAPDHRDTLVDLQAAFTRAYDQGRFGERIDYTNDPAVPLADDDRSWLRELLKSCNPVD